MSLSSSSLFHFTSEKSALFGILESNFEVHSCKETIVFGTKKNQIRVPMVSFCDIPLSQIKDHISKYGNYGIGLTKEWGIRHGLNPVLYLSVGSSVSLSYLNAVKHFVQRDKDDSSTYTNEQKLLLDVIRYVKNYEGQLERNGNTIEGYRYSDEREWRYVPPVEAPCDMFVSEGWYELNDDNQLHVNTQLKDLRLHFEPNDIKYIIIKNDAEIAEVVNHLRRAKGTNYYYADVERLTTRILTCEQIMSDI